MRATFYTPTDRWRLGARLNWVSVCIFDLHDFQIGCAWGSVCAPGSRFALARGVSVCEPGSRFARLGLGLRAWVSVGWGAPGGPTPHVGGARPVSACQTAPTQPRWTARLLLGPSTHPRARCLPAAATPAHMGACGPCGRAGRPNTARGRGTARVSMPNGAHTTPMDGSTATWALHTPTGEVGQRGSRPSPPHAPGTGSRFCARRTRVLTLIARVKVLTRIHGTAGVKANVPLKGEHNGEKGYVLNAYGQSLHLPINQCPLTT